MGIRNIEEKLKREAALREKGVEIALKEIEGMISSVKLLSEKINEIEKKFKNELKTNPQITQKLMSLREELGLPKELGIFEPKEKPGLIDKLTGGGFYEQLGLQILDIGKKSMKETGGVMSFPELIKRVQDLYQGHVIGISDIQKALDILKKNELIAKIETLESGFKLIHFVTQDLSPDMNEIIKLANRNNGQLTREQIIRDLNWSLDRVDRVISHLEKNKIVMKDESFEGIIFYFPGI
jgi:hypothetical protein